MLWQMIAIWTLISQPILKINFFYWSKIGYLDFLRLCSYHKNVLIKITQPVLILGKGSKIS